MAELKLSSEKDAFDALKDAINKQFADGDVQVVFDKWPTLELRYEGEGFSSTLSPQIMEGLLELQRTVNRTYAQVAKQQPNATHLRDTEKEEIELRPHVSEGSSLIKVDLAPFLEKLAHELVGKMSGEQIVFTVIGLGLMFTAGVVAKVYIASRQKISEKEIAADQVIAMSEQETERMKVFASAVSKSPPLQLAESGIDDVRRELIKAGESSDTMEIAGIPLTRESAKIVSMTPRGEAVETQLNGNYFIRGVSLEKEAEVKLRLEASPRGTAFTASFTDQSLDRDQIKLLQAAEWGRSLVYLLVNARVLHGAVTAAKVVSVRPQPAQQGARVKPATGDDTEAVTL